MTKKWIFLVITSILAFSLLAACGEKDGSAENNGENVSQGNNENAKENEQPKGEEPPAEPEKPRDPVEITLFHYNGSWTEERNQEVFADPVTKKYPHLQVKAIGYTGSKQLEEMVVAGTTPDLIMSTPGPGFETTIRRFEAQQDLTALIKQFNYDLNKLDPASIGLVQSMAPEGQLYSLPIYMSPNTVYVNQGVFEKFGVDLPKDGMSWDEMYDLARTLTREEDGAQYRGFLASYVHILRLNQVSQKMFDSSGEKTGFDTSEFKNYLRDIFRIFELPGYGFNSGYSIESNVHIDSFVKDQTVAMLEPAGVLLGEEHLASLNNQWDFTSFPSMKEKPGVGQQPYPFIISMFSTSKHKDEAFEVMAYLTSEEYQTTSSRQGVSLPVMNDRTALAAFGQDSELYQGKNVGAILPKQFAPVPDEPFTKFTPLVQGQLYTIFPKVLREQKDINTAFREATEAANQKIEEEKAK